MPDESSEKPALDGDDGPIRTDVHCHSCGYNLRGLLPDGQCPECGEPIELSLRGNLLRNANVDLVKRVYRGVRFAYGSVFWLILGVLFLIIIAVTGGILVSSFPGWWDMFFQIVLPVIGGAGALLVAILYPLGWWWATTPDPVENEREARDRRILRWTAIGFVVAYALSPLSLFFRTVGASTWRSMVVEISTHLVFALIAMHIWAIAVFAHRLYARCDPPITAKRRKKHEGVFRRGVKYAIVVPVVLVIIHWISVVYWMTIGKGNAPPAAFGKVGFGAGIGFNIISLCWLAVISQLTYLIKPLRHERLIAIGLDADRDIPYADQPGGIRHRILETDI